MAAGPAAGDAASDLYVDRFETCPDCGYTLYRDPDLCPECGRPTGADLRRRLRAVGMTVPATPIAMRSPSLDEEAVDVLTTPKWAVAIVVEQHLTARGMPVRLIPPHPNARQKPTAVYRLQVGEEDQPFAAEVVSLILEKLRLDPSGNSET